jgi:hypothetical protein
MVPTLGVCVVVAEDDIKRLVVARGGSKHLQSIETIRVLSHEYSEDRIKKYI